jgi:transcriptional regulator with XRE-family HTH domain
MSTTTELIRELRARKLSQTEISRLTGIPQPRLSRWEGGEVPDAADDALKLLALRDRLAAESAPPAAASTDQAQQHAEVGHVAG